MNKKVFYTIFAVGILSVSNLSSAEAGSSFERDVDRLMEYVAPDENSSAVREDLIDELESQAEELGISLEESASLALRDVSMNVSESSDVALSMHGGSLPQSGIGVKYIALGRAKYIGDVFYSAPPGSSVGHNGIFDTHYSYVEAANPREDVVHRDSTKRYATAPTTKYYVGLNEQTENKRNAARFAVGKIGKRYNLAFWNNKHIHSDSYNCSQLVWASYKHVVPHVDLDHHNDKSVYPHEIALSHWTVPYETVR